ncbi:MAG: PAS domain S-box protein [Mariprofundaceae bacterium]
MNSAHNSAYKELFHASLDAIVCSNETGLITLWNRAAEKMFGYSAGEAIGQPLVMLMSSDDQYRHQAGFKRFINTGERRFSGSTVEVSALGENGLPFPVELSLSSSKTAGGWHFIAIIRDISARKQVEETLSNKEAKYRKLLEASPDAIFLADCDSGLIIEANRQAAEMMGLPLDKMIGMHQSELHPPEQAAHYKAMFQKHIAHGRYREGSAEVCRRDGSRIPVEINASMVEIDGKQVMYGVFHDVSARKQSEQAFGTLVASIVGQSGQVFFDRAVRELASWLQMECVILAALSGENHVRALAMILDGKPVKNFSYHLTGSPCANLAEQDFCVFSESVCTRFPDDKQLRDIGAQSYIGISLRDADGHAIGILCAIGRGKLDPPERMREVFEIIASRAALELQRSQMEAEVKKLSHAITYAGESVVITDREGVIEYVNPAFTKLTGYSAEEAIGQTPRMLKSGNQDAAFYQAMWKTITSGKVWHGKVVDRKKDGSFYPAILTISPVFDADGNVMHYTHFVGLQSDLSELETLEKQFHQAQKMEAIGTLVGGIAHDFNNMLAGMNGNIYLARQAVQAMPDVLQKLANIEQIAFRASDMIQQLLTFARRDRVSIKPIPFTPFIKETFKLLRPAVPENIAMVMDVCSEMLQVRGDATQLHQVLMNLVNNARDAVDGVDDPCITIRLEAFHADAAFAASRAHFKSGAYAHLSVTDNGCGIPEKQVEHLFEPFFTTKEQGKGTGLGLAMVFGAIKTHHGIVEVESSEASGSTFHTYIPLLAPEDIDFAPAHPEQIEAMGRGELILLVDDDTCLVKTGQEVLEMLGYRVMVARDGQQAVDMFTAHREEIALIILDVVMPLMSGGKAAELIRRQSPDVKIIFSTGYDKNTQTDLGNETVLVKPFSIIEMSHLIRQQLNR